MYPSVPSSTIYNSQDKEATQCPPTEERLKKTCYVNTMEYCSTIKKNEIMPLAAIWMDLERVILSEVSQTEKEKYCMISLTRGI